MRAKTTSIRPGTIVPAPSQSIVAIGDRKGTRSEATQRKAATVIKKTKLAPIQKYHCHGRVSPPKPPKHMPEKKPKGENAPKFVFDQVGLNGINLTTHKGSTSSFCGGPEDEKVSMIVLISALELTSTMNFSMKHDGRRQECGGSYSMPCSARQVIDKYDVE